MRENIVRFAVALGGLLIFAGIIMVGVFALVFLDIVDVIALETQEYPISPLWILVVVGVFDLAAGIILRRK